MPHPGPLDAFVWLDRGIYRPGETVQVMALLRDAAGLPADIPAHVHRSSGRTARCSSTRCRRAAADASVHLPVALSHGAPAGMWTRRGAGRSRAGRRSAAAEFRVDAFVPDRMAVDLGPAPGPIVPGKPYALPVAARFLYGAPGAGLTGKASMRLVIDPAPFPALAGYRIGLVGRDLRAGRQELDAADTDAQGHATLPIPLPRAPDSTQPLKAEISVEVNDPSGHASRASHRRSRCGPAGRLIGIKPLSPTTRSTPAPRPRSTSPPSGRTAPASR